MPQICWLLRRRVGRAVQGEVIGEYEGGYTVRVLAVECPADRDMVGQLRYVPREWAQPATQEIHPTKET